MQSFHAWCENSHAKACMRDTIVSEWIKRYLRDSLMPWHNSCQEIYDYLKDNNRFDIEAFLCAWEMSGRVVEIDEDYSSETFDEEEEEDEEDVEVDGSYISFSAIDEDC